MYPIEGFWRSVRSSHELPAVLVGDEATTYRDLGRQVLALARAIVASTGGSSARVALAADDTPAHLTALLAVLAAGGTWVPLNPRNGDPELLRCIDVARPRLVLADDQMADRLSTAPHLHHLDHLVGAQTAGSGPVPMGPRPTDARPLDGPQAIKFTGGSTGRPKGVVQPYRAWNTTIVSQIHAYGLDASDRLLVAAPLTHGTSTFLLPVLATGGALVFPDEKSPDGLLEAIQRHRVTVFFAPPTLLNMLVDRQGSSPRDVSSLRYATSGGAPIEPARIEQAQRVLGDVVAVTYGQTEAPTIATFLAPRDLHGARLASVGRATPLTQVALLDARRQPVDEGAEGEVAIRGDLVMSGYLDDPEATREALVDGWLLTGDLGTIDEDGFLYLRGRSRDVIISGGFNVYPTDVEAVLATHPGVRSCAVVGLADPKWGEAVHAAVVLHEHAEVTPQELTDLVRHELGGVRAPKGIHLFDTLPHSPVGKILKDEVRRAIERVRTKGTS